MTDRLSPIVFLGPTLDADEARRILGDVRLCPPVRCGDVLSLLRVVAPPTPIGIIDGVFERVGATWHKELLFAMERGHALYGAASMGALRAAELADFGMVGVGQIFEEYRSGRLLDDDEVAVLHSRSPGAYRPLTDPMVNVRATMERALAEGAADRATAADVIDRAKRAFFHERVLATVVDALPPPARERLAAWLPTGYVDRKRQDATLLLERLARVPAPAPATPREGASSTFLRTLQAYVACRPMPFDADWLPSGERLARAARMWGLRYLLLRDLALARAFATAAGVAEEPVEPGATQHALGVVLREYGIYGALGPGPRSGELESTARVAEKLAREWCRLEDHLARRDVRFEPEPNEVRSYAARFARDQGLKDAAEVRAWRERSDLVAPGRFPAFLIASMKRAQCLSPGAADALGIAGVDPTRAWLLEALEDTGIAEEIDDALNARKGSLRDLDAQWAGLAPGAREALASACDFDGYDDLAAELERAAGA